LKTNLDGVDSEWFAARLCEIYGKVYVKNSTMLTRFVSTVKFELYTLEGGGSYVRRGIRHK